MNLPETRPRTRRTAVAVAVAACLFWPPAGGGQTTPAVVRAVQAQGMDQSALWLAPPARTGTQALGRAVADLQAGRAELALPVFTAAASDPVLGGYALLYQGRAQLALNRPDAAAATARQAIRWPATGALADAAYVLAADASEAADNWADSAAALQALADTKPANLPQVLFRLGRAATRAGDIPLAAQAFTTVYYDAPLSDEAVDAAAELARLSKPARSESVKQDFDRAEQLYQGRRYTDARKSFEALRDRVAGDDRWIVDLRLAECDFRLQRYPAARDALRSYLDRAAARLPEAEYFYISTLRAISKTDDYAARVDSFVSRNPASAFAEQALNDLATVYILDNDDAKAAVVFDRMLALFPTGTFAERAIWKSGWWAYKNGDYRKTMALFEPAAVTFRRSDYRPSWLYWSARAHQQLNEREPALIGYEQVIGDYRNSYYGRMAAEASDRLMAGGTIRTPAIARVASRDRALDLAAGVPPSNARLIQSLLGAGLYDDAIAEIRRVEAAEGVSPLLEATVAYALNRKGELRPAITAMRRAYPQFMAAGGEALPREILGVIFPVSYWDLIRKYAGERKLDPFLIAALIAQESTFQADVRSSANAWGLMQLVPDTGRRYARPLGIPAFSVAKLTDPEINIQIGVAYFADLVDQFKDVADALAAYNAGPNRVSRWRAERPGVSRDEFIDDIPFPETQNYVKRVVGTAEDYRFLYGGPGGSVLTQSAR